jgi:GNAT superfamily N-acetyltransferase
VHSDDAFTQRVRTAHGDWWQTQGQLRTSAGGAAAEVRGARLMASGLRIARWNAGDITSPDVDLEAVAAWYASRDCGWGLHVPLGMPVAPVGRYVFTKRCMGLLPNELRVQPPPDGIHIRRITPDEADTYARIDADVFDDDADLVRAWVAPEVAWRGCTHWLAFDGAEPIGVTSGLRSDGYAGPSGTLTGIGVRQAWRRRGLGAALAAVASADLFDAGASLVHLNPNSDAAARVYARVGFREVPGFDIYEPAMGG